MKHDVVLKSREATHLRECNDENEERFIAQDGYETTAFKQVRYERLERNGQTKARRRSNQRYLICGGRKVCG